jgi:hypothetical protein
MRLSLPADRSDRLVRVVPWIAVAVAEGAWIAVVAAGISIGVLRLDASPGVLPFAMAAGLGIAVARPTSAGTTTASAAGIIAVLAAGLLGWLADPSVRSALAAGEVPASPIAATSGLLLAFAAWRGTRHRDPDTEDIAVSSLLAWGVPGLAIPWLLGTISATTRQAFAAEALPATLVFVAAGLAAIGLLRLDAVSREAGVEWRSRRAWVVLIAGVVAFVLLLGVPAAILLDVPLGSLFRSVVDPIARLGEAAAGVVGAVVDQLGPENPAPPPPGLQPGTAPGLSTLLGIVAVLVGVLLLGILVLGVAALARGRRRGAPQESVPPPERETRRIILPRFALHLARPRIGRVARLVTDRPRTAADAYATLMADRAVDPETARRPSETPATHARRLRGEGRGAWGLDLLAADYALERYRGARLSAAENRRGVARWRRLRRGWPAHKQRRSPGDA